MRRTFMKFAKKLKAMVLKIKHKKLKYFFAIVVSNSFVSFFIK